ncbi:Crp/Fnr family transcriptional regulator [Aquabacter spiritensis]|uniref:Cyclic nucleotide-binding protein n=1 Tax=Aquabacter spiritensis TaxID=933073 RepID=A0A4R3M123_9HYPH|nr:Crp/Fnr family transcriptional regulator [Aquabacter spiritensis]TCT06794.1 cyclic nucleotide-binding protein [Aquabacter spiritensis]
MSLEQDVAALQGVPTFEVLPPEALRSLAISAEIHELKAGDVLFRAGEISDAGYVVLSGRIELVTEQAGRRRRLCELLSGALVGETALFVASPRPATARALEAATVLRISRPVFVRVLEGFPEAATLLRAQFAERLEATLGALDALRREKFDSPSRPAARRR